MRKLIILLFISISLFATQKKQTIESCIKTFDICENSCSGTCSLDGSSDHSCFKKCRVKRDNCIKNVLLKSIK